MEKREFTKQAVLEVIRAKAAEFGTDKEQVEIRLTSYDFLDKSGYAAIIAFEHIPEAVIELEDDTGGEVRLVSTLARTDKEQDPIFAEVDEYGRDKFPPYYVVRYTKNPPKRQTKSNTHSESEAVFYWSQNPERGLCRMYGSEEANYPVSGMRRKILERLTGDFTASAQLASEVGLDTQNLLSQIGQIRKQLEKHFKGIDATHMIEAGKGHGYKLGKGYLIK